MKLVYIHQYFNRPSDTGSTRSYEMARRLVAAGHEVHLITSDRGADGGKWRNELLEGINIHWFPVAYSNKMSFRRRLLAFFAFAYHASVRSRALRGDVVLASSTPLTVALPGIYATLFRRGRLVLEVRDLWPEVPIALGALTNRAMIAAARALEWIAYRRSTRIVALSEGMKEGIVRGGFPGSRVDVIPNASDLQLFNGHEAEARSWRHSFDWLGERPLVVHCGTMGYVNGVEYLVHLAAAVLPLDPDIRFATVGDGNRAHAVKALAEDLGVIGKNFFMLPPVAKTQMPAIFRAATITTCLVAPVKELENNSANKVFDSFAAGKPVAINYGGWQRDLLRESGAGICLDPLDPAAAAIELLAFLGSEAAVKESSAASLALAKGRFNRDKLADELERSLQRAHTGC